MVPICICELSFFDYFIRIGNFFILVYFLLYFIENKFLVWLRKEEEWTVIDRQMLDTLFDNNEKNTKEAPELEQEEASEEAASEEEAEAPEEAPEEAAVNEEAEEASTEMEMEKEEEADADAEASKILNETEIIDTLMK